MSNFDGVSFEALCNMIPTESSVQELCLKFIIDEYVLQWPQGYLLLVNLLVHIKTKFFFAKERWICLRKSRLNHEVYLGINDFEAELIRSCGEFCNEFKNVLGFSIKSMF